MVVMVAQLIVLVRSGGCVARAESRHQAAGQENCLCVQKDIYSAGSASYIHEKYQGCGFTYGFMVFWNLV